MAANSLGLLIDIPQRSLLALKEADLLLFEEDRGARPALKAAGIHKEYRLWNEHKDEGTLDAVKAAFKLGHTVVYMSDQGIPTLADPGRDLLVLAYKVEAEVSVIPGPSSLTAALAACPFLENGFVFVGFLPREEEARQESLRKFSEQELPLLVLDTPYRRQALLQSVENVFGGEHCCLLAEDISGPAEKFSVASVAQLRAREAGKLNFVLLIAPARAALKKPGVIDKKAIVSRKADKSVPPQPQPRQSGRPAKPRADQTNSRTQKPKRSPR